jgi:hypothetical protein
LDFGRNGVPQRLNRAVICEKRRLAGKPLGGRVSRRAGPRFGRARLLPSRRIQSPCKQSGSAGASPSRRAEAAAESREPAARQAIRLSRSFALPEGRGCRRIEGAKGQTSSSAQQELRPPGGPQHNRDCEREAPAEPQDFTTRRTVRLSRRFALTVVPRPSRVSSDPAAQRIPGSARSQTP